MKNYCYCLLFISIVANATQMDDLLGRGFSTSEVCSPINTSDPTVFLNRLSTESSRIAKAQQSWQGKAYQSTGQAQQYAQEQVTEASKSLRYIDNLKTFFNSNCLRKH
ncbi:hypothetical protein AOC06_04115 [Polynucleobacter paludilacus]|nr:hypothetical protein AOC06_04115 [Polynucleobacter paludilacus]